MWFRRDLRLGDNPAWAAATAGDASDSVTALFVLDPALFDRAGPYRQAVLLSHLRALDADLASHGGRLRVEHGEPAVTVSRVADELDAVEVHFNTDTTPYAVRRDTAVAATLGDRAHQHWGTLVHEPGTVLTGKGTLSQVFTPFYKVWQRTDRTAWIEASGQAMVADEPGTGLPDDDPTAPDISGFGGGEAGALERLHAFDDRVDDYLDRRDLPAVDGTSALSGDLRFGTLSPRNIIDVIGEGSTGRAGFVRQLAWRDWYAHMILLNPTMPDTAIRADYDNVRWRTGAQADAEFAAWSEGQTGYPIVDAGMRQLSQTGWMHNRVRMIVGSFLVKDLLIDWRRGERWFRHLLIDADVSQNVGNWQWVAGCGTDAAPYFRIFNPWTQSRKFDPSGDYLRRWVPELAELDDKLIHEPAAGAPLDLAAAGVILGDTYPDPIVNHSAARDRVLAEYKRALGRD